MQVLCEAVLWKYHLLRNGQYTVKVRFTRYKEVEYIKTNYSSSIEQWDEVICLPSHKHPKFAELVKKIENIKDEVEFEVKLAKKQGNPFSLTEIKNKIEQKNENVVKPKKVLEFFDVIIDELEQAGRVGYADIFTACKSTVYKLLSGKDKAFISFTDKDFKAYEKYITSLETESTKSLYLRTFYRIWNLAIERKHCPEKHHPKFFIKYKAYKKIKTKKRAISFDYISKIETLQFEYSSRLFRSLQYFIFSYYSRGINFCDLAKLKHGKNIYKGHLYYKRSKNSREYDFELHPKAKEAVRIFENYPLKSNDGHVFPILNSSHDMPRKIDTRIESALKDFNEDLGIFEEMIDSPKHITSYVIRHAFATNLRQKNVDIAIIKEAMGHETENQTNTYLEEIDDSIISKSIEDALK